MKKKSDGRSQGKLASMERNKGATVNRSNQVKCRNIEL
jgi:hypothetical protein